MRYSQPVVSDRGLLGSTCTNSKTNVMLGSVPVGEFGDSSLREVEMMSNGILFSSCTPHANDLPGSSLCNSLRHGLEKLESTGQVSPTRFIMVKKSTTGQILIQAIQVHLGTVVYSLFSENPLSTLCNLWYSPITDTLVCIPRLNINCEST